MPTKKLTIIISLAVVSCLFTTRLYSQVLGTGVATGMQGFQGSTAPIGSSMLSSFNTFSKGISGRASSSRRAPDPLAHSMRWSGSAGGGMVSARPVGLANVFINNRLTIQPIGGQLLTGQRVNGLLMPTNSAGFSSAYAGQGLGFRQIPATATGPSGLMSSNKVAAGSNLTSTQSFDFDTSANAGGFTGRFSSLTSNKFASLFSKGSSSLSSVKSSASKDGLAGSLLPQNLHSLTEGRTLLMGQTTGSKATSYSSLGGGGASRFSLLSSRGLLGRGR